MSKNAKKVHFDKGTQSCFFKFPNHYSIYLCKKILQYGYAYFTEAYQWFMLRKQTLFYEGKYYFRGRVNFFVGKFPFFVGDFPFLWVF